MPNENQQSPIIKGFKHVSSGIQTVINCIGFIFKGTIQEEINDALHHVAPNRRQR